MKSIARNNEGISRMLISQNGIKLDLQNSDGDTALHCACDEGQYGIVQILLHHGADQTIKNNTGKIAIECCKTDALKQIFQNHGQTKINLQKIEDPPKITIKGNDVIFDAVGANVKESNIKYGTPNIYYREWNKIFKFWGENVQVPIMAVDTIRCTYVDEKMDYHVVYDDGGNELVRVRFFSITKEDGLVIKDLYNQ